MTYARRMIPDDVILTPEQIEADELERVVMDEWRGRPAGTGTPGD